MTIGTCIASAEEFVNYLYDMGAADSKVVTGYTLVTPDDVYTAERGYGFTTHVSGAFEAEGFSRFGALISDGVAGRYGRREYSRESLVFRVDVMPGYYMVEVGVPDGPESRVLQIYVNGAFQVKTQDSPLRRWDSASVAVQSLPSPRRTRTRRPDLLVRST